MVKQIERYKVDIRLHAKFTNVKTVLRLHDLMRMASLPIRTPFLNYDEFCKLTHISIILLV